MGRALSVIGVPTGAGPYSAALEGLTALNEYILRANPQTPRLYESGVRYTKDSTDTWRDLTKVLATKSGDCEALSTWRTAELRVSGEDPNASVVVYKTGPTKFHAIVLRGDGSLEDPSVELGMKPPSGLLDAYASWNSAVEAAPQQEERPMVMGADDDVACAVIGANNEPHDGRVVFDVIGTGEGFKGQVRIPLHDGRAIYATTSTAANKTEAAKKAQRVLGVIGSFWDDLAILVPSTQAQAAIRIAKNEHVQNLAKDAYQAGKRAIGKGDKKGPTRQPGLNAFVQRQKQQAADDAAAPAQGDYIPPGGDVDAPLSADAQFSDAQYMDEGQGAEPYDEHGAFMPSDVMGWDLADLVHVNGVLCGVDELACLGHINEAMARMSKPRTVVGAARRAPAGGRGGARGGAGGGRSATPAAFGGPQMYQGGRPQTFQPFAGQPGAPVSPFGGPTPFGSPYGAPTPFGAASPYGGPPPGVNPQSAAAMALYQRQQNMLKSQMLQQSGGSGGGGGGGGYDGGGYGGDYTASDAAADQQADADLWNAYYGNQALQEAQQQYFDTAQETSADQFFGAVDPYTAEAMLQDDSIPAQ